MLDEVLGGTAAALDEEELDMAAALEEVLGSRASLDDVLEGTAA